MPDTEDPDVAIAAEIKGMLMRPGVDDYQLPEKVAELLATHMVVVEKLDVAEVRFDRSAELIASLRGAWKARYAGAELPGVHEEKIKAWTGTADAAHEGGVVRGRLPPSGHRALATLGGGGRRQRGPLGGAHAVVPAQRGENLEPHQLLVGRALRLRVAVSCMRCT